MTGKTYLIVGGVAGVALVCICVVVVVAGALVLNSQSESAAQSNPTAVVVTSSSTRPAATTVANRTPAGGPTVQAAGLVPTAKPVAAPATVKANAPTAAPKNGTVGAYFLPNEANGSVATSNPSLAIDAKGGIHTAYRAATDDNSGNNPIYYAYCAANCNSEKNFAVVSMGQGGSWVNLALDPAGNPRLVFIGNDPAKDRLNAYMYATCDRDCTKGANWALTRLVATDEIVTNKTRFFALDPQGRPRFVYYDRGNPEHTGTFFAYCDANCSGSNASGWQETKIYDLELVRPSVSFDANGSPRLAFYLQVAPDWNTFLSYAECDRSDCSDFQATVLYHLNASELTDDPGPWFSLSLDRSDRPRMILYSGRQDAGDALQSDRLYYLWCNASCTADGTWGSYPVGLPENAGSYADLLIDGQGRPQFAYEDANSGLSYAWCSGNCEAKSPTWQNLSVETGSRLDQLEPVPRIVGCNTSAWIAGSRASLALDPSGNPRIAYDANHMQGGSCRARVDLKFARLVLFNKP